MTVPEQFGKSTVTYTNINAKTEITASHLVTNLNYTATGAGCPKTGTFEDGTIATANVILKAEKAGTTEQVPLFIE